MERLKLKAGVETVRDKEVEWLAPPPETLIVIVDVPVVAVAVAVKETVTVQVGVHGLFVKDAVTPLGRPDAENVSGTLVPLTRVAVIDELELVVPCTTPRLFGEGADRPKSNAGALTVKDKEAE